MGTLAERIGAGRLELRETAALLLGLCDCLRQIHSTGLAHADLVPVNIRIAADGRVDIDSFPTPPSNATLMIAEPKYAAPELLLTQTGADGAAHLRCDAYVLAFVAYEALAGSCALHAQLFEQPDEAETDLFWMKWHADTTRRLRPLCELTPQVPPELSAIIERMLEKDPAARLGNFEELESALKQLMRKLEPTDEIELAELTGSITPKARKFGGFAQRNLIRVLLLMTAGMALLWWAAGQKASLLKLRARWRSIEAAAKTHRSPSASTPLPTSVETESGPMMLVRAGSFVMGSSAVANESPARTVYLPAFYVDKYEVSNARYRAFTDSTGYFQPPAPSWDPDYFAKGLLPVINVSWRDAQAFCVAAGKRLPSEAEWEKAARGASPQSRFWANWTVNGLANLKRAGFAAPLPIGSFAADVSPYGVYDMAGNVHEWVNDAYGLYDGNANSLNGNGTAKVVRGGSFAFSPPELSPSWRASLDPSVRMGMDSPVGFRCAADARLGAERPRDAISVPGEQSRR